MYATVDVQPLDVEALARGVHMSAGHLSREFKLAYGESPYSTIAEMMAKGTYGWILLATKDLDSTFERLEASGAEVVQEPTGRHGRSRARPRCQDRRTRRWLGPAACPDVENRRSRCRGPAAYWSGGAGS
jgi:hypothetical protein